MLALWELQQEEVELRREIVEIDESLLPNDILQHAFEVYAAGVDAYSDPKQKGVSRGYWNYMNRVRGDFNMELASNLAALAIAKDPAIFEPII